MVGRGRRVSGSVRGQLTALGLRPRKSLGQHFLSRHDVAERIAALASPQTREVIVEIGPGLGILTEHLAALGRPLVLVEMDAALAEHLRATYESQPHVQVIHADATNVDFGALLPADARAVVVGNLPYNAGTQILLRCLSERHRLRRVVVMLQREVAERLIAGPGTKTYGSLSIAVQLFADVRLAMRVGKECFVPSPKVESAVIVLDTLSAPRVPVGDPERFVALVRAIFNHRRKQLCNAAKGVLPSAAAAIERAGLDPQRRPETLSLAEFARLIHEAGGA